ncbi:hypothetical protein PpBr36_01844 [Pyricularia pennisetigena]|uniref:hypothetical protein n=1 Tax=Pyricularia pennisetigena TaxID=1578925 RepID=UPI0011501100|nr:hypothetical protein PpBr36_01844 [Pyricularia pennisetigena]TLS28802.1 hypothetical protein PpBr36_01844 [Pyricularia pennisetigena]
MASPVADLEANLMAMQALKPPGVSGSKIKEITALCVGNVKSESVLIQKLFTHFKRTPGTHKLGVLYVVDSVTRKWMEQARQTGQAISSAAEDGTFAAGVHRVTELMPSFMNDILGSAPDDQKEKIRKLVDIWEKGQTFPSVMLEGWKTKLDAPRVSTTPPGSPPPGAFAAMMKTSSSVAPAPPPAIPDIMETLANLARQNASAASSNPSIAAPAATSAPAPYVTPAAAPATSSSLLPQALAAAAGQAQGAPGAMPFGFPTTQQPPVAAPPTLPFQFPGQYGAMPPVPPYMPPVPAASSQQSGFPSAPVPQADPNVAAQQVLLIQTLLSQGIAPDMVTAIVQQLTTGAGHNNSATPQQFPPPIGAGGYGAGAWNANMNRPSESHDRDRPRSPGGYRGRSRSRSPGRNRWDQGYGARPDDRDNGGRDSHSDYRQRSPQGRNGNSRRPSERYIEFDPSLPENNIRVLSRTLFIGGVTCSESELRSIFSNFGEVQTCIVNRDKRHGFVKMLTRKDAEAAKDGMMEYRSPEHHLRTRWGVGFGPRDCSDYAKGISVIPIHRLTEADKKWMLTAPFGGTGGKPISTGMVVEEPDIEIGAGVSSKAISRRMQTDRGGMHGPRSSHRGGRQ